MKIAGIITVFSFFLLGLSACQSVTEQANEDEMFTEFEKKIAQKLVLDIRYFCPPSLKDQGTNQPCLQAVTQLPEALANMITNTSIGGVVLFAENLISTPQIVQLTHDLQQAALKSATAKPLIISIDQEGGRVVRLPHATSFAGNMAIGATYTDHKTKFATQTSAVIAQELISLGINNNYAPVVDVNTNANNPVINTRSFGDNPQKVAELGVAAVNSFQQFGVMATLKHFPGHGDTHIDSHLGLPLVAHDLATIKKQDLAPFQWAIKHSSPAMIMTAHIQYPALDDSTIENIDGEKIIRPATMSRKILTDLLRDEMGFDGLIATDALDMAGISHYFDAVTTVAETFTAGADLAVMPFKIRQPSDLEEFTLFIKAVAKAVTVKIKQGELTQVDIDNSVVRINQYKTKYISLPTASLPDKILSAQQVVAQKSALQLEQKLADNSVVLLKNETEKNSSILPLSLNKTQRIHLLVANQQEFLALQQAIKYHWQKAGVSKIILSSILADSDDAFAQVQNTKSLLNADIVIATIDVKLASAVDFGGAEDLATQAINDKKYKRKTKTANKNSSSEANYSQIVELQLIRARQQKIPTLLIAKGSPYLTTPYVDLADAVLLTFEDRIYQNDQMQFYSAGFNTSMAIAVGRQKAIGQLPVSLKAELKLTKH